MAKGSCPHVAYSSLKEENLFVGVMTKMSRRRGLMSDDLKYELARELGFSHKVKDGDWGNITTREAGSLVRAAIQRAEEQMVRDGEPPQ